MMNTLLSSISDLRSTSRLRTLAAAAGAVVVAILLTAPLGAQVTDQEFRERQSRLLDTTGDRVAIAVGSPDSRAGHLAFQYLTGILESDAVLLVVREGDEVSSTIFLPETVGGAAGRGAGGAAGVAGGAGAAGAGGLIELRRVDGSPFVAGTGTGASAPAVRPLSELDDVAGPLVDFVHSVTFVGTGDLAAGSGAAGMSAVSDLFWGREDLRVRRANGEVNQMRAVKSPAELALIRRSVEITDAAHRALARSIRPGVTEADLKVVIDSVFEAMGADPRPAFGHIVASAENSTVLHYRGGERVLNDGEHVKIDIGAQVHGYAADVTRTYPVNGRFSKEQRDIFEIVRAAQAAAEAVVVEGLPRSRMSQVADSVLSAGLVRLGLMEAPGAVYDCPARGEGVSQCPQLRIHYFHSLGHGIGLNVHDPTPGTMEVGSAVSIEPGIYLRPGFLDDLPDTPRNREMIAHIGAAYRTYEGIGVRIEDDFFMTEQGLEWISRSPRDADAIEAAMAEARAAREAGGAGR